MTQKSRRNFLKAMGYLGGSSLFTRSALLGSSALLTHSAHANNFTDYKAIVCIMLEGGNDGGNLLVNMANNAYQDYKAIRPSVALEENELADLSGTQCKVHNSLAPLLPYFDNGKLAFIANAGMLNNAHTTQQAIENKTADLPRYVFSHNTMRSRWQHADPDSVMKSGWGGRILERWGMPETSTLPSALAFNSRPRFLANNTISPYVLSPTGVIPYDAFQPHNRPSIATSKEELKERFIALQKLATHSDFAQELSALQQNNIKITDAIQTVLQAEPDVEEEDENAPSNLEKSLQTVYKIIKNRDTLSQGLNRQMFYLKQGGYDSHNDQKVDQAENLAELAQSLAAFQASLDNNGLSDQVTVMIMSDFGRTITANDDGTDHGWGSHYFVLGNAVKGGQVHGDMPNLSANSDVIVKNGRLLPQFSTEQYFYPICRWFGVTHEEFLATFPNANAFDYSSLNYMNV